MPAYKLIRLKISKAYLTVLPLSIKIGIVESDSLDKILFLGNKFLAVIKVNVPNKKDKKDAAIKNHAKGIISTYGSNFHSYNNIRTLQIMQ